MNWLLKNYMQKDKIIYIFALLLNIVSKLLSEIWPVAATGKIIDIGITQHDYAQMIKIFIISIVLFITGRLLSFFSVILIDSKTLNMNTRLSNALSQKVFYLDHNHLENTTVGELNILLGKDIRNVHRIINYDIKQFLGETCKSVFSLLYCCTINPIMAISLLTFMPIYYLITINFAKKTDKLYDIERKKTSVLDSYIQETVEGNRLIRNLATEEMEINKFKNLNNDYVNYKTKINFKMYNYIEILKFLGYLMWAFMIFLGGIFIVNGTLTLGEFMIFNSFIDTIMQPLYNLISYMNDFKYFKISLNKIKTFMSAQSEQKDLGTLELQTINNINFDNVTFKADDKIVLSNINLQIEKNKTYAFIGEIGSGKSSIGKLILRIIDSTKGKILINNINIEEYTLFSLRDKIAYVSQTPFLFSDTIKNNVNFGNLNLTDDEVQFYLKLAKADYVKNLEDGIETIIGENGISLSGGEKQRLSLARALAKKPQLLILDDITSALDYESELEVTNNINNLDYDCTKIIIAQKIISVKNADKIFVMKSGKIIGEGTHQELLQSCDMYKEIFDIQSGNESDLIYI